VPQTVRVRPTAPAASVAESGAGGRIVAPGDGVGEAASQAGVAVARDCSVATGVGRDPRGPRLRPRARSANVPAATAARATINDERASFHSAMRPRMPRRPRSVPALSVVLLTLVLSPPLVHPPAARAWGCTGHVIVATAALELLSTGARTAIGDLLDGGSLQAAACWPDDIRPSRPETKRWHYVDVPGGAAGYDAARDCAPTPEGDCLVAAIERSAATLRDRGRPKPERAEALRFLSHLVGDLHQPLHCDDHGDRGGNDVSLDFLDEATNLHALWDSGLIEQELRESWAWPGFPESVYALLPMQRDAALGSLVEWTMEAHAVAESAIYARMPDTRRIGTDYLRGEEEVLRRQLARAGVRLAILLEAALGAADAATPTPSAEPTAPPGDRASIASVSPAAVPPARVRRPHPRGSGRARP
jgi:S1/P1 Nuclease